MHPPISHMMEVAAKGDDSKIAGLLAKNVQFLPSIYGETRTGRAPIAAVLAHVGHVYNDCSYRRVMGNGNDWALELQCKVGELDAVGVDMITLNEDE